MYPPSRIKVLLRFAGVRYVHAQGRGAPVPVRSHGAAERAMGDPRRGGGTGGTRGPRPRGDDDPGALRERQGEGTRDRGVHGGPIPMGRLPPPTAARHTGRAWGPAVGAE